MIYAINSVTKEHRNTAPDAPLGYFISNGDRWEVVKANIDGWIKWDGGECPLPDGHTVDVHFRCGERRYRIPANHSVEGDDAGSSHWRREWLSHDIIAYRPILDEPRCEYCDGTGDVHSPTGEWHGECTACEPEAPEWDGLGLPPVGVECELAIDVRASFDGLEIIKEVPEGTPVSINGRADFGNGEVAVFSGHYKGSWFYGTHKTIAFRPIRSEEDKAIEDMANIIMPNRDSAAIQIATALYRGGYRKL